MPVVAHNGLQHAIIEKTPCVGARGGGGSSCHDTTCLARQEASACRAAGKPEEAESALRKAAAAVLQPLDGDRAGPRLLCPHARGHSLHEAHGEKQGWTT